MKRVLIVDDVESDRELLRTLLVASGFEVEEAENGAVALDKARAHAPDLCISDLLMPVKDGFSLLREWKADPRLSVIPFLVYTATYTDPRDERLALDLGADAFIVKPAEPDDFLARMHEVLASDPMAGRARPPASDAVASDDAHRQALERKLQRKVAQLEEANFELSIRNAQLQTVLQTDPESVLVLSDQGRIVQVNDAGLRMLQASSFGDLAERDFLALVVEEDRPRFAAILRAALRGEGGHLEHHVVGLAGEVRVLETHANLLRGPRSDMVLCVARDVTEPLRLAEAQERERAFSSAVLRGLPGVFYLFDESGHFVRWNDRFEAVTGYSAEEIARLQPVDLFAGADRQYIEGRIAKVFAEGESDAEATLISKSGMGTPYYFTGVRSELGGKRFLAGTGVDLSARRAAEQALVRAAAWQRAILQSADAAVVSTRVDGIVQSFNAAAERIFGYAADEVVGKLTPVALMFPAELSALAEELSAVTGRRVEPGFDALVFGLRGGGHLERDWTGVRKDGRTVPLRVHASSMVDSQGADVGFLAVATDLTDRNRQEATLRLQAAALDAAANAIMITGSDGTIEWVNRAFSRLTGYSVDEALGANPRILKSGVQAEPFYAALWQTILRGEVWRAELVNRRKDGSFYEEEETITPLVDERGEVRHFIAIKQDISSRRRAEAERAKLEERLRVADKLNAIGSLTGGIAHDFNNMLAVVLSCAHMILERLPEGDPIRADVLEIRSAGEQTARMTKQLLAFGRKQVMRMEPVDLNRIARSLQPMLARLLGEHLEVELALASELGLVRADPSQMEQVIVNLAVNARDAMPEGGRLGIETANVALDAMQAAELDPLPPGEYVRLSVRDTGVGMDAATRARSFEPFFTTKAPGSGTGLGLATVHGIVEQSGGCVEVHSELGAGTTFQVYLPRISQEEGEASSSIRAVASRIDGTETVLVVEDEPALRRIVERRLKSAGYTVLTAANGLDALAVAAAHAGVIQLVITDVVMPKLGGRAMVESLTQARSDIEALYLSGFAADAIGSSGVLEEGVHFLAKPFDLDELLRKVRKILDG